MADSPNKNQKGLKATPIAVDLFCGPGGLSLGFSLAGFSVAVASDWNESVERTYTYNHPETFFVRKDTSELSADQILSEAGDVDIVIGGPPCQGFSVANTKSRNMHNPASAVSWHFIRLVKDLNPKAFVMENVLGFLSMQKGEISREFCRRFKDLGFEVFPLVLSAEKFGVPQKRQRIFFIGTKNGKSLSSLPFKEPVTVGEAIGDLPKLPEGGGGTEEADYTSKPWSTYQERAKNGCSVLYNHRSTKSKPQVVQRFRYVPEGGNWKNIPPELMADYKDLTKVHSHIYKRLIWGGIAVTVANFRKAVILHPRQNRIISVREAARIQSFPDRYRFFGNLGAQQQQVADAVPPLLAQAVAETVLKLIS